MWLRRGYFRWLYPAAILLPVWLVVGWSLFGSSAWAFLGILFIAAPAILVGELVLTLLIRARPTVRADRAVSWWDVLGVTVWHVLIIAFGCFFDTASFALLVCAIIAFIAVFWSSLAQLLTDARGTLRRMSTGTGPADVPTDDDVRERARQHAEVIVVQEVGRPGDGRSTH